MELYCAIQEVIEQQGNWNEGKATYGCLMGDWELDQMVEWEQVWRVSDGEQGLQVNYTELVEQKDKKEKEYLNLVLLHSAVSPGITGLQQQLGERYKLEEDHGD